MKLLRTIDERLRVANRKVRLLTRINPVNARSEFRKFISLYYKAQPYNPVFKYAPIKNNLHRLAKELSVLPIPIPLGKNERWFFSRHLRNKRKRILDKIKAVEARGTWDFKKYSTKLFGRPPKTQTNYARIVLTEGAGEVFGKIRNTLDHRAAGIIFQKYLRERNLPWSVKIRKNISSKAGLDAKSKYLLVKEGDEFAPEEVLSLVVHEIETHIYRRENGIRQSLPGLFGEGFAGPPTTEEGLAFFNEIEHNYDPRRMLIICARTIAAHLAKSKSFSKVFHRLLTYGIPPPYAWATTLRVKRGFTDTSLPGAFGKDHHYLKGYIEMKKFLGDGGRIESLYIGKLNISTLKSLAKFGIQTKAPRYLPRIHENN